MSAADAYVTEATAETLRRRLTELWDRITQITNEINIQNAELSWLDQEIELIETELDDRGEL